MQAAEDTSAAPIACTLSAADMGPRLTRIRELSRRCLRSHELQGTTLRLRYAAEAWQELVEIVELERACCGFLDFQLNRSAAGVELVIDGPDQVDVEAQWLFSQFMPETGTPSSTATACACCRN